MFNQYSPIVQNMMNQYGSNYINQQPQYNYNPYGYQQQQYYNQYNNGYNYYNPYGNTFSNNSSTNYFNQYGYNYMGMSPMALQRQRQEQIDMYKLKLKYVSGYYGKPMTDEEINEYLFPKQEQAKRMTDEERIENAEFNMCANIIMGNNSQPTNAQLTAQHLIRISNEFHKMFDDHSMFEFLENDLWKLEREEWIRQNIDIRSQRNLNSTYSSKDYTELLQMHNSSHSGFVNQLLSDTRYDNNITDVELGMNIAFDAERRRRNILEGRVPQFISSDEVQERRNRFTQSIMNAIINKGGGNSV